MAVDRDTLRIGPAKVAFQGGTFFFQDGLTITVTKTFVDVVVDAFDVVLKAHVDTTIEVSGTPKAWQNMQVLNPFADMAIGQLLCGGTDSPLVITPINGAPLTLACACVRTPPNLMLSARQPFFASAVTWAGVLANGTEWSTPGSRYTIDSDALGVALTGLDTTKLALCTWSATLGGVAIPDHEAGISIQFSARLTEQPTDSLGLVDWSFDGIAVTVGYVPVGVTETAALAALGIQGVGVACGKSATPEELVVTGATGGRSFTLADCVRQSSVGRYNRTAKRVGEVQLVSVRGVDAGALTPLYSFAG